MKTVNISVLLKTTFELQMKTAQRLHHGENAIEFSIADLC